MKRKGAKRQALSRRRARTPVEATAAPVEATAASTGPLPDSTTTSMAETPVADPLEEKLGAIAKTLDRVETAATLANTHAALANVHAGKVFDRMRALTLGVKEGTPVDVARYQVHGGLRVRQAWETAPDLTVEGPIPEMIADLWRRVDTLNRLGLIAIVSLDAGQGTLHLQAATPAVAPRA